MTFVRTMRNSRRIGGVAPGSGRASWMVVRSTARLAAGLAAAGLVAALSGAYVIAGAQEGIVGGVQPGTAGVQGGVPRPRPARPAGPVRPPRDPREQPAAVVGTGVISGRVVDDATGQPIARARVRLAIRESKSALTGVDGTFTFDKVPAGAINLFAEKSTYLPAQFPEIRRTLRTRRFTLAEGQKLENLQLSMRRASAIVGRIVDSHGDPVEHATIQAFALPARPGASKTTRLQVRGGQSANDIGEFRVAPLEPGSYILVATSRRGRDRDEETALGQTYYPGVASPEQAQPITLEKGQTLTGIEWALTETALTTISGTVTRANGEPVTGGGLSARRQIAQSLGPGGHALSFDGTGGVIRQDGTFELRVAPGDYVIEVSPSSGRGVRPETAAEIERGVARVSVGAEPLAGLVITTGTGATVSGRIVFDGSGRREPPDLRAVAIAFGSRPGGEECRTSARPTVNPDGTFTAENVWGACTVSASSLSGWQLKSVQHGGADITTRPMQVEPGRRIDGLQVVFTDRVGDLLFDVADDSGNPLAEYVALVFPVSQDAWSQGSAVRTFVTSAPDVGGMGGNAGAWTAYGDMSARPVAGRGAPPPGGPPQNDPAAGAPGGPPPGGGQFGFGAVAGGSGPGAIGGVAIGPAVAGVRGLLAGEYFAVVLDDVGIEDVRDPEFLAELASRATRVSVIEGETKSLSLRRVTLPDGPR